MLQNTVFYTVIDALSQYKICSFTILPFLDNLPLLH